MKGESNYRPVAAYSFSGNANDETGSGNHGTLLGAVLTKDRLGRADSAYSFDGVDDYIEIPQPPGLNPSQGVSLVAWILVKQEEVQALFKNDTPCVPLSS